MRCLIALLVACLALAAVADARDLIDRKQQQVRSAAAAACSGAAIDQLPSRQRSMRQASIHILPSLPPTLPPSQQVPARRSMQQTLHPATVCPIIASDPDLASMADAIRPGCALLQSPEAQAMIPQLASSMGLSPEDVNVVLGCICSGSRRRALGAGASTQLTPQLIAQLVAQYPELQSMVDSIRPFCSLLSSVDVAGMLAGQGFSPADVQALLTYICG